MARRSRQRTISRQAQRTRQTTIARPATYPRLLLFSTVVVADPRRSRKALMRALRTPAQGAPIEPNHLSRRTSNLESTGSTTRGSSAIDFERAAPGFRRDRRVGSRHRRQASRWWGREKPNGAVSERLRVSLCARSWRLRPATRVSWQGQQFID